MNKVSNHGGAGGVEVEGVGVQEEAVMLAVPANATLLRMRDEG